MSYKNLQQALDSARSPVEMLRNSQIGPYAFPVVPSEFTNWRDEQRSWRETCALFDQSHHMTDLYVEGPDALKLISSLGVNTFNNFRVDTAKQFVACNHDGYVIGDAILFHLAPNSFVLVGRPPALNWVQYNLVAGKLQRQGRARRALVREQDRRAARVPLSGAGTEREEGHGQGHGQADARHQVLPHEHGRHRRLQGPRAAPRHGRAARLGDVRPVGRRREGARRDRRGRCGVRHSPRRRAHVSDQHARVRLDSVADARRLHAASR